MAVCSWRPRGPWKPKRGKRYCSRRTARVIRETQMDAEADAFRIAASIKALQSADPRIIQALVSVGMEPRQLIAQAFGGLAERAEKIGQLNLSPDLLQTLLAAPVSAEVSRAK